MGGKNFFFAAHFLLFYMKISVIECVCDGD